jgi:hypothetical protein
MNARMRGQGSLEFLMTYGWVLLIILVVLVIMWQWGLFSLGQRIEPGSFGFWGLAIQQGNEFILDSEGDFKVSLINNAGANLTILTCNITIDQVSVKQDCGVSSGCGIISPSGCVIKPGNSTKIEVADTANWKDSAGKRFDALLVFTYADNRTKENIHQSSGRVWGIIEARLGT